MGPDGGRAWWIRILVVAAVIGAWGPVTGGARAQESAADPLGAGEVETIVRRAAEALGDPGLAVAVVDRAGQILGVYERPGADPGAGDIAVSVARTAAFFTNDQAPLSSRTVRSISGIHFPAGIPNTPNAALYGIENTNRGCRVDLPAGSALATVDPPRGIAGIFGGRGGPLPCEPGDTRGCAAGGPILDPLGLPLSSVGITTGKANLFDRNPAGDVEAGVHPGGIPLLRDGRLVGGIGVTGAANERVEYAATLAAATAGNGIGFPDGELPEPGAVFIDGIRLPFFGDCTTLQCVRDALEEPPPALPDGPAPSFDPALFLSGTPRDGESMPDGFLVQPRAATDGNLTLADVEQIVDQAIAAASETRAVIRLPLGQRSRMVISVADTNGEILALYRMPDSTIFSVDVALTKSRNAYYFSSRAGYEVLRDFVQSNEHDYRWEPEPPAGAGWAMTNRTLSFGGQPLFPPGIDLEEEGIPGPWFDLFVYDSRNACTEGPGASRGGDPDYLNQSGIVWFPGSAPLYKDGELVGGLGISGDGVEQDDYVSARGSVGFQAPPELRVDRSFIVTAEGDRIRLPYWRFPRNPLR